jgi:hypothetical protein
MESGGKTKQEILDEGYEDYVRLTEDVAWVLIAAVAESTGHPQAQRLARGLLTRQILPHFKVEVGKKGLLSEALRDEGFIADRDFHLLDATTTMYKASGGARVFVDDGDGGIEEVSQHSETITAFRDKPEAESFLIVLDQNKRSRIEETARDGQKMTGVRGHERHNRQRQAR